MTYSTGNPVPSLDPRDLDDNAEAFDRLLQSSAPSEPDRLGVQRKTWHQMELDAEALVSPNVAALAGLLGSGDKGIYFTGVGALAMYSLSPFMRGLSAQATAAGVRTSIGLGTAATANLGVANGVATLGADGLLPVSQLPPLAINETFTVASQAAMLALTAQRGDAAIRSDLGGAAYLLTADAPSVLANWVPIQQNLGVALTALGALTPAADMLPYFNGTATAANTSITAFGRSIIGAANAVAARTLTGAAASGANGDITSLTGLTTPLSGAQGGLGVATQAFTNLTLANSWAVIASRRAGYRKITADLVFIEMQITSGTATDGTALCTPLPAGFRPANAIAIPVQSGPNTTPSTTVSSPRVVIGTDGSIVCQNCSSGPGVSFTATFSTI